MQVASRFLVLNQEEKRLICPVKQIGSKAKALLAQPGFSGKVLAVLSKSVYLAGEDEEILWLSREGLPMHRRSVMVSFWPGSICPGQNFFVDGPFLQFPDGATVDLDSAIEWMPSGVGPEQAEPLIVIHSSIRRLFKAVIKLGSAKGLGQTIPLISSLVDGSKQGGSIADPLLARTRSSILDLAMACLNFDIAEAIRRSRELVGLGPGLTPSGDDFLGGLLFTAQSLKTGYPQDFYWEERLVTDLIHWASSQTHPISYTILRDHAIGHGPGPLHDVVAALLNGQDISCTMGGVERLLRIGETSGWDILAGMLTGMLLVAGKLKALPT